MSTGNAQDRSPVRLQHWLGCNLTTSSSSSPLRPSLKPVLRFYRLPDHQHGSQRSTLSQQRYIISASQFSCLGRPYPCTPSTGLGSFVCGLHPCPHPRPDHHCIHGASYSNQVRHLAVQSSRAVGYTLPPLTSYAHLGSRCTVRSLTRAVLAQAGVPKQVAFRQYGLAGVRIPVRAHTQTQGKVAA